MCEIPAIRNHGMYDPEALPDGWGNAEVWFRRTNGREDHRIEIIDLETRERYPQEPLIVISLKCLALFFLTPFYFLFYSLIQTLRVAIVPVVNCSPLAFVKELWHIVKIPLCFAGVELASLYGVFKPLEGRAYFGKCEGILHGGKMRREAEQYRKKERLLSEMLKDALFLEEPDRALFLGFCMQTIGRADDAHITQIRILPAV